MNENIDPRHFFAYNRDMMKNVNIDWGYHTMVKKLEFLGGDFFIGKFVRKSDGLVSWHMHERNGKGVSTNITMVIYEANDDNVKTEEEALMKIIKSFENETQVEFSSIL